MISIRLEKENDKSNLIYNLDDKYEELETVFELKCTKESLVAHKHIIFSKCKLIAEREEEGTCIVNENINFLQFKNFIRLLYGNELNLHICEIIDIYMFVKKFNYYNIDKLKSVIINNVDKISNDKIEYILNLLKEDEYFSDMAVLMRCNLSQLKHLSFKITDISTLRTIILIVINKYNGDTF